MGTDTSAGLVDRTTEPEKIAQIAGRLVYFLSQAFETGADSVSPEGGKAHDGIKPALQ